MISGGTKFSRNKVSNVKMIVDKSIEFETNIKVSWISAENDKEIPYSFPEDLSDYFRAKYSKPYVYRWLILEKSEEYLFNMYLGETENLYRRIYHYLKPGPSQQTNIRLNNLFQESIAEGNDIKLEVLEFDEIELGEVKVTPTDLSKKHARRFVESLLLTYYQKLNYPFLNA